ncbi:MAG: polysaccharide biosynthesis/export family protein [Bryobacteraceae bacterium]
MKNLVRSASAAIAMFANTTFITFAMLLMLRVGVARQVGTVAFSAPSKPAYSGTEVGLNALTPAITRVGPGDLLSIKVFDVPELEQTVRVGDAGDATFSLIGRVHVSGKTTAELQEALEGEYRTRNLLVDPHIAVLVTEYATQGVSVMGEVTHPGTYPLIGPHTLLNLISTAGGLTQLAGETVSIGHHDGSAQIIVLNANDPAKALARDVQVMPGDRVVVSRASIIYVVGDVGKPGGFQMQNNGKLTVLQAIALASGVNKTAALNQAKLIHNTESGYLESNIHLDRLLHGKSPDIPLAAQDILFVPNSRLKTAVASGFSTAIQAITTAAIYRP